MGISASLPRLKFYLPPTSQGSWSKRPFHVSLSSSLWTDLLMVAMLFRLNEFSLAHLLDGFSGFWLPVTVFFAVYDVWETRVLFDSVFRFQDDLIHHLVGIIQWLLLALMATTITPTPVWDPFDMLLFAGLKLAHQTIRVLNYGETWMFSLSKRARKAAKVRLVVYICSWPFFLAPVVMLGVGNYEADFAAGMWVIGFFVQRLFWAYFKWDPIPNPYINFAGDARAIKANVPFKTTRYGDWTMLQLGAIVLGFMTVPTTSLGSYGVLIFGYTYVAALNLLAYSMNPEDPNQHALIKGGMREFAWLEFFSLAGLSYMGIAVGLRVHLFYPTLVVLPRNRHYTWILCISAMVSTLCMFGQEYSHGGQIMRLNGGKVIWLKIITAGMFVVAGGVFIGTDTRVVAFVILGLAVVSLAVLLLQVLNGAFRRQIIKTNKLKLLGNFRAAIIGMVWLARARRNLRELEQLTTSLNVNAGMEEGPRGAANRNNDNGDEESPSTAETPINHMESGTIPSDGSATMTKRSSIDTGGLGASFTISKTQSQPEFHHRLSVLGTGTDALPVRPRPLDDSVIGQKPHHHGHTYSDPMGGKDQLGHHGSISGVPQHAISAGGVLQHGYDYFSTVLSSSSHSSLRKAGRSSVDRGRRLSVTVKNEIRVWKIVLNERVYTPPKVFAEGNKATKYRVQWSDLFFDVLFVGVVFRLGDLLLSGIGAGYSEASVHYEDILGGDNSTIFHVPTDPPRSDAVFIFASVFVAVWAMWQNKLAYSSKVGTNDVAHKFVDMAQGLAVLLCAVNITTPNQMEDASTGNAYAVAGALLTFQLSMVGMWIELFLTEGRHDSRARGTALRNIQRDSLTVLPLLCSFATIATGVTLSVTTFLWSLSWLLPFVMRVAVVRFVNDHNAVRDLHRYVIHRLGDGALIVLGEGVLQIIRADSTPQVFTYLTVTLGLFLMTAARIAVWSMDCFTDPSKHAQLLSLDAGLAAYFIRSIAAPSLVGMGVAMKKMISVTSDSFKEKNVPFYWLLCGACSISLFTLVITYELHRFSFYRKWRTKEFAIMVLISSFFLYWASIPAPAYVIVALSLFTWLLAVIVHFFLDDYFLLKEQAKTRQQTENSMKRAGSGISKKGKSKGMLMSQLDDDMIHEAGTCTTVLQLCGCGDGEDMTIKERLIEFKKQVVSPFKSKKEDPQHQKRGSEDLPGTKQFVPLETKQRIRINDEMGPEVGILERQPSIIIRETRGEHHREMSALNPQYEHVRVSAAENGDDDDDGVVVVVSEEKQKKEGEQTYKGQIDDQIVVVVPDYA